MSTCCYVYDGDMGETKSSGTLGNHLFAHYLTRFDPHLRTNLAACDPERRNQVSQCKLVKCSAILINGDVTL
jgi:hypothetical protein